MERCDWGVGRRLEAGDQGERLFCRSGRVGKLTLGDTGARSEERARPCDSS